MSKTYKVEFVRLPHHGNLSHSTIDVNENDLGKVLGFNSHPTIEVNILPIKVKNIGWHQLHRVFTLENGEENVYYHQPKNEVFANKIHASKTLIDLITATTPKVKIMD